MGITSRPIAAVFAAGFGALMIVPSAGVLRRNERAHTGWSAVG